MADQPQLPSIAPDEPNHGPTLTLLLQRIRTQTDFPALSEQILRVQAMASSESGSPDALTTEILKDVALTNKVLRIVNSAQFAHVGAGHINTVSRAVGLIGFTGVRNVATSLVLLDHMDNKAHATQLRSVFAHALLAATLASALRPAQLQNEEVFIGALFQNLGHLLAEFYLPDEAQIIRQRSTGPGKVSEEAASEAVLGLSYEALGLGVGQTWGLPDTLLRLMRKQHAAAPMHQPSDAAEQLHWVAVAANELADVYFQTPPGQLQQELHRVAARYAGVLGQSSTAIENRAQASLTSLAETAHAMGLHLAAHQPGAHLLKPATPSDTPAPPPPVPGGQPLEPTRTPSIDSTASLLAQGIQDVTAALLDDPLRLHDVLRMVLETMVRGLGFEQAVLCIKDPRTGWLNGRLGLGPDAVEISRQFQVNPSDTHNLFAVVCQKGMDTLIHDASDATVQKNLPDWYRHTLRARSLVLLPLHHKGATFGLIYLGHTQPNVLSLDDKGLALLKTLRNQAVMAFRQAQLRH